jgi:hypothetical protein
VPLRLRRILRSRHIRAYPLTRTGRITIAALRSSPNPRLSARQWQGAVIPLISSSPSQPDIFVDHGMPKLLGEAAMSGFARVFPAGRHYR